MGQRITTDRESVEEASRRSVDRAERWNARLGHLESALGLSAARAGVQEAESSLRGAELVRIDHRTILFDHMLLTQDGEFPIEQGVTARTQSTGTFSSEQGWVFKSRTDTRDISVTVDGPNWYAEVPVFRANRQPLGDPVWDLDFKRGEEAARALVTAINNAAKQASRDGDAERRTALDAARDTLRGAEREVEIAARPVAQRLSGEAMDDYDEVVALLQDSRRLGAVGRQLRRLHRLLDQEIGAYQPWL